VQTVNLDRKHYILIALALGVLASWGSREVYHSWQLKDLTTAKTTAEDKATKAEARATQLETQAKTESSQATEHGRKRTETHLPNGTVQITDVEFDRTLDQVKAEVTQKLTEQYEAKLTEQRQVVTNLSHEINELQVDIRRSAPRWAAMLDYEPWATPTQQLHLGGGINLGAWTVGVGAAPAAIPVALGTGDWSSTRPRVGATLRF
jgi:hypothetical protein